MAKAKTAGTSVADAEIAQPWFREEALKFLRGLKRNNRREWFEPRRPLFEREIRQPMLAVIERVTEAMLEFAPEHVRPARKCMMRIYRDTRFSSDKRPYKGNIAAWWTQSGLEKTSGGGFYFHITPEEVVIAAGVYMPEKEQLYAIRSHLLNHHAELRRLLTDKKLRRLMELDERPALTRAPKGFPVDHPALDLLKCRQWGVHATLPAAAALEPALVREIVKRFQLAAPLVAFLNTPLTTMMARKKPRLFGLP